MLNRKLRMGLVGGGPGSFIAPVHHKAAIMDGKAELVAGAFSRDPQKSAQTGKELMLDFPSVDDGVRGMQFIETVVKSAKSDLKWTEFVS
jgi:predicted dehydrogenase